jgi:iron complex transport system permease protein
MRLITTKKYVIIAFLTVLLFASLVYALSVGAVFLPLRLIIKEAFDPWFKGNLPVESYILWQVRLPRVILSALVGAALALSGVILQGLFRNPMAEPYVIGVSFGGALGATIVLLFGGSMTFLSAISLPLSAFIGAIAVSWLVYRIARVGSQVPVSTLLLSGIAVSAFISAIISLMMALRGEDLHTVIFWLMGSFSARNWRHVEMVLPFLVVGFLLTLAFHRELNLMLLGEEKAAQLGVEIEKSKKVLLAAAALMAGAAVSVSGLIGFVGLVVPHMVRLVIGPDHKFLIPGSAVGGALLLLIADALARQLMPPSEIPVGIITALFGAPFFLYLLKVKKSSLA